MRLPLTMPRLPTASLMMASLIITGLLMAAPAMALSGQYEISGRLVPLPPGEWQLLSTETTTANMGQSGMPYAIGAAVLTQESGGKLTGMVIIGDAVSLPGSQINWFIPSICTREDTYARMIKSAYQREQDCVLVNHAVATVPPEQIPPLWRPYWAKVSASPAWEPKTWLGATFRETSPSASLTVTYRFSVEAAGFPRETTSWAASRWHPPRIDGARRDYADRIKAWAIAAQTSIRQSFDKDSKLSLPAP
ncbi:hypothetical protein IAI18_04530 [Acetobacteraceae bacterium H6797]|nr:hypothetical protein [Acetobacteraceae bacterium H6797]